MLPENVLSPKSVYKAAILFLVIGALIGAYFVVVRGPIIAFILAFAVFAIFFYSTKVVNFGLAELFVGIKGSLIVIGSFYVQTSFIEFPAVFIGTIIGMLSSSVLLVNSFPDYDADRLGGRRTLVIMLGKRNAYRIFLILVITVYAMIILGTLAGFTNIYSVGCLVSIPYALKAIRELKKNYENSDAVVPAMAATVYYSRVTSLFLAVSMMVPLFQQGFIAHI